ncbi:NADH dehydrogenase subunit [bacterium]|nr:NADH dehydrogenase subunit [bacterium]
MLLDQVKQAGVVGAGGAGFPTHVKLQAQVEYYLVNGAECEPLMHKDRELMCRFSREIVQGLQWAADCVHADKRVFGIKSKNQSAIQALKTAIGSSPVSIHEFGDYYPAGDEYELVYGITGRLIPPQGLPLQIGTVVNNVETLFNIYQAAQGQPVTDTFLTITGAVKQPMTTRVPIGMQVRDVLALAGGPTCSGYRIMESGLMMGRLLPDDLQPVTKTTGGLIVLPEDHRLIQRYTTPPRIMDRIGHSACDQCSYCTELCPRYLLGYDVQPHLVMRSLGFTSMGTALWNKHALLCCQCGICTLYACPEGLHPREACLRSMTDLRTKGEGKWQGSDQVSVHRIKDSRRVPVKQLMRRLGVMDYDAPAEFVETSPHPEEVRIPLKQHVGVAAEATVKAGDKVERGQLIGRIPEDKLAAAIHASIAGVVAEVTTEVVTIRTK